MSAEPSGSLSARLHAQGRDAWDAAVAHPMVKEIAAGTLPRERFRFYFEQNIPYLEDYARCLAAIASKTTDSEALEVLTGMLDQIMRTELPANRSFLERLGGGAGLGRGSSTMAPAAYAYTRHLLATSALGDCAAALTAVLPCQWSYGEIGASIYGSKPDDDVYADWIEMFGNVEYAALVDTTTRLLDRLAGPVDPERFERLQAIFDTSTRYEVEFWDMAYGS